MKKSLRHLLSMLAIVPLVLSLTACGNSTSNTTSTSSASGTSSASASSPAADGSEEATEESTQPAGKTKITSAIISFESLDPYSSSGSAMVQIGKCLYEPLVIEEDGEIKGVMAKSWEWVDERTLSVEIYDYIYDTDGNQITADDVVFSYNKSAELARNPNLRKMTAEKTGEYTVNVIYPEDFYPTLVDSMVVKIVSQTAYEAAGEEAFTNTPVGTGAYTVTEFISGSKVVMEKTNSYWQTDTSLLPKCYQPNVDVVQYDVITESAQIKSALEMGIIQVGLLDGTSANDFDNNNAISVRSRSSSYSRFLMFKLDSGPLAESLELRQAICYALDLDAIAYAVTGNTGHAAYTVGNEAHQYYLEAWENEGYYDRDLDKAKELLAAAGYKEGELTLRWMGNTNEYMTLTAQVVQANLLDIGVNLEISSVDNSTYIANRSAYTDEWDISFGDVTARGYYPMNYKNALDTRLYEKGNGLGTDDQECQALLMEALLNPSDSTVDALHQYVKDNAYLYGLYVDFNFYGVDSNIEEMVFDAAGEICPHAFILSADYDVFD